MSRYQGRTPPEREPPADMFMTLFCGTGLLAPLRPQHSRPTPWRLPRRSNDRAYNNAWRSSGPRSASARPGSARPRPEARRGDAVQWRCARGGAESGASERHVHVAPADPREVRRAGLRGDGATARAGPITADGDRTREGDAGRVQAGTDAREQGPRGRSSGQAVDRDPRTACRRSQVHRRGGRGPLCAVESPLGGELNSRACRPRSPREKRDGAPASRVALPTCALPATIYRRDTASSCLASMVRQRVGTDGYARLPRQHLDLVEAEAQVAAEDARIDPGFLG